MHSVLELPCSCICPTCQAALLLPEHRLLRRLCHCLGIVQNETTTHVLTLRANNMHIQCKQAAGNVRADSEKKELLYHHHVSSQAGLRLRCWHHLVAFKRWLAVFSDKQLKSPSSYMHSLSWQRQASVPQLHRLPHGLRGRSASVQQQPDSFTAAHLTRRQ